MAAKLGCYAAILIAGYGLELSTTKHDRRVQFSMARRKELQGICNDLIDSFVSRYNDLDGYWAIGKFQTYLQSSGSDELCFDLTDGITNREKSPFSLSSSYYRGALRRHLKKRDMPLEWVPEGQIRVLATSPTELVCTIEMTTDLGRGFNSRRNITARPHNPFQEYRSAGKHGPKNQKGE